MANNDTISEEAKFKSLTVVEMAKFISDCSDTIKNQFKQIYMALTPNVKKIVMMTSAPSTLDLLLSWSTNSEIMNLNHNLFINEYSRNKIAKLQEKINAKQ